MSPQRKLRCTWTLSLLFAVVCVTCNAANDPIREKTWTFKGQNGTVKIKGSQFERNSDHRPYNALELWVEDGRSGIEEEGRFLSFALIELPKNGFELSTLSHLLFRLDQTDAERRIASFAAESSNWKAALQTHSDRIMYPVVTEMLNKSGAFRDWLDVFQAQGIDGNVVGIEELGTVPFAQAGVPCPSGLNCTHLRVPITALVQINFRPARSN